MHCPKVLNRRTLHSQADVSEAKLLVYTAGNGVEDIHIVFKDLENYTIISCLRCDDVSQKEFNAIIIGFRVKTQNDSDSLRYGLSTIEHAPQSIAHNIFAGVRI